jgi:hypothetical protein
MSIQILGVFAQNPNILKSLEPFIQLMHEMEPKLFLGNLGTKPIHHLLESGQKILGQKP